MAKMNPAQGLGLRVDEPIVSRVQSAGLCDGARQAAEGTLSMKKLILFTAFAMGLIYISDQILNLSHIINDINHLYP